MAIKIDKILNLLKILGFAETDEGKIYSKNYSPLDYKISIDLESEKIDYGSKIVLGDKTTSNFENPENFIVLECVNRLLEKGYRPEDLELEKRYQLGRTKKGGKADITVKGKNKKTLIIIECKTYGYEFDSEIEKMRFEGGQLFSYFQQDRNAKFLCLYTSQIFNGEIEFKNKIVFTEDGEEEINAQKETDSLITYSKAGHVLELVEVWKNKIKRNNINEFEEEGIFEDYYLAYQPGVGPLKKSSLKELVFSRNDANNIYRQFEEALRHHNISDRSNAFNRVISLILAKIVDEEKSENEVLDFQIKPVADTPEELYDRLASLYKRAMDKYLKEKYTFYSSQELEDIIVSFPKQTAKDEIRRILKETKHYSNNEFAFKEIYNKELFEQNFQVLKEIIQLFQPYRFKYNRKAQLLGDFFENLLEEGFKQTEGQFFTPTPLAKFIVSSLPLKEHILDKIIKEDDAFLPRIIDYACGSGHFLTESIEEIQQIIEELPLSNDENIDAILNEYKQSTRWAKDFIFGIEKDYRLARTSQVACFMHGDGDANVVFGDGLELWNNIKGQKSYFEEETFDFLVANPPYSIKDFTKHLNEKRLADFELLKIIKESGSNPDDIEVLFLERTKQLLRIGGIAGVFFPSSILSSTGLYTKAREILIKHFEIKAIFEPGPSAFAKTGTKTLVLFIKRRNPNFALDCRYVAEDLILKNNKRDNDFVDSLALLNDYINYIEIPIEDYMSLISRAANSKIVHTDFFKNYKKSFTSSKLYKEEIRKASYKKLKKEEKHKKLDGLLYDYILSAETEKFEYFLLTHRSIVEDEQIKFLPQQLVIVKAGESIASQRAFLGYIWSDAKTGAGKGIQYNFDENKLHKTKLYEINKISKEYNGKKEDIEKTEKNNPNKANYYVYNALIDNFDFQIAKELEDNINLSFLVDCFDFNRVNFEKQISLNPIKIDYQQIWGTENIVSLSEITEIKKGTSITKKDVTEGDIPVVAGGKQPAYYHDQSNRDGNIVTISASGTAGFVNYFKEPIFASDCITVKSNDENQIPTFLIYNFLTAIQDIIYSFARGASQPHVYPYDVSNIKIPLPNLEIQQKIIDGIALLDEKEKAGKEKIEKRKGDIDIIVDSIFSSAHNLVRLADITDIINGGTPDTQKPEYWNGNIFWATLVDTKNKYLHSTAKTITELGLNNSSAKLLPINTIIFSSRATIGSISIAKVEVCTNQGFKNFICDPNFLDFEFLYYILKHESSEIASLGTGMTYPEISKEKIASFKIPLPSLEEQQKIVSKILKIEQEVEEIEQSISNMEVEKKAVFKKYL